MPTYTPDIKTGGNATVSIGGVAVYIRGWKVSKSIKTEDISTVGDHDPTTDLVYMREIPAGVQDDISFDAFVDMNNDVLATLEAGVATLSNVVVTFRSGKSRTYPEVVLTGIEMESGGVMGANKYSCKAKSSGKYTTT